MAMIRTTKQHNFSKNNLSLILLVVIGCAAMAITDAVVKPTYVVKSAVKIVFFLLIPLVSFVVTGRADAKKLLIPNKKGFIKSILYGVAIYAIILGAYFLLRNVYDFSSVTALLGDNLKIDGGNFIFVAVYISLVNSMLEEFFFRGIAFLMLSESLGRRRAYIFSSIIFALYHVAIMTGWFSTILFALALAGLVLGGAIFNRLDEKNGNIYCSWMTHMFANFAINTVGFILFGTG